MNSSVSVSSEPCLDPVVHESARCEHSSALGWVDRHLRSRLLSRLGSLRDDQVQMIDADGLHTVGPCGDLSDSATINVLDPAFYRRVATTGSLGAAESFMNGEWTSPNLVALLRLLARGHVWGLRGLFLTGLHGG